MSRLHWVNGQVLQTNHTPGLLGNMETAYGDIDLSSMLPARLAFTLRELNRHFKSPPAMNLSILLATSSPGFDS